MSPRAFLALLVVTAVSVVATVAMLLLQVSDRNTSTSVSGAMFPALAQRLADLDRVVVEQVDYSLDLRHHDGQWVAAGRGNFPLQPTRVEDMMATLAGMSRIERKTDDPDWYRYVHVAGVNAPEDARGPRLVAFAGNGDVLADTIVGDRSASVGNTVLGAATFMRPTDEAQTWLVEGTLTLPETVAGWFDGLFHIPGADIAAISVLRDGNVVFAAEKMDDKTADYILTYVDESLGPEGSTANDNGLRTLSQATVSVTFEEVRLRNSVKVPKMPKTVRFTTQLGMQIDMTLARADEQTWVLFDVYAQADSRGAKGMQAIADRVEDWAFRLPERRTRLLEEKARALFHLPGESPEEQATSAEP